MEILAAIACISVVELVILTLAFRWLERADQQRALAELQRAQPIGETRPRFFAEAPGPVAPPVPREALLARLERHVRLEQEAAELFLRNPTAESLHYRMPPPVHLAELTH